MEFESDFGWISIEFHSSFFQNPTKTQTNSTMKSAWNSELETDWTFHPNSILSLAWISSESDLEIEFQIPVGFECYSKGTNLQK